MKTLTTPLALALLCALPLTTACRELRFEPNESTPSEPEPEPEPEPQPEPEPEPEPTPAPRFAEVAVSSDRSCAIDEDGRVLCWGLDLLSDEWGAAVLAPSPVSGVEGAIAIAVDDTYACALIEGGGLRCWGQTPPVASVEPPSPAQEPFTLPGSGDVVSFALSSGRVCGVLASGSLRCWGVMTDPGDCFGPEPALADPFDVPGVTDALTVAVSGSATCFTRAGGNPSCYLGLVGETFELPFSDATSLRVSSSDGCFSAHASFCAVTSGGAVDCVEGFSVGELGEVTRIHDASPPAVEIAWHAAPEEYCIEVDDGSLWCAATGETVIEAEQVAIAATHACALAEAKLSCWGSNEWGALGLATPARRSEAGIVVDSAGTTSIAAGLNHSCASNAAGEVRCWGSNQFGQRGWEASAAPATYHPRWKWYPEELSAPPQAVSELSTASAVFADAYRTCASEADGSVVCWGQDLTATMSLASPAAIPNVSFATSVASGDDSQSCAVTSGGTVQCWGWGWYGARVGVETLELPAAALEVDGDVYSACALLQTGDVYCWGGYVEGSIGSAGDALAPQKMAGVDDAIDLSEGCVVTAAHELVCWAFPWQPGLVEQGVATTVASGILRVDGPCVVRDSGQAACFLDFGELAPESDLLLDIAGAAGAVDVASGQSHACALLEDGHVACWGWSAAGRLGDGSRTAFTEPQLIVSAFED